MIQGVPYDAEIEYLQSTGTQWIDTGIKPDDNTQCYIDFMVTGNNTSYDCVAACEGSGRFYWVCARSAGNDRYVMGTTSTADYTMSRVLNKRYAVTFNGPSRSLVINGTNVKTLRSIGDQIPYSLGLFAENYRQIGWKSIARIYACKLTDKASGTLLRDFIPVRVGTVGYMYDRVSGKLFGNMGTGSFVLGQDIAIPIKSIRLGPDVVQSKFWLPMPGKIMRGGAMARDYIQDGLVAMWDGIENAGWGVHDNTRTTWKDLAGVFPNMDQPIAGNAWEHNCVRCDSSSINAIIHITRTSAFFNATKSECSYEIVFQVPNPAKVGRLFGFSNTSRTAIYDATRLYTLWSSDYGGVGTGITQGSTYINGDFSAGKKHSASITLNITGQKTVQYLDGKAKRTSNTSAMPGVTSNNPAVLCPIAINGSRIDTYGTGIGGGVRFFRVTIYNRVLSAAEIAHNHTIDVERFGVPS